MTDSTAPTPEATTEPAAAPQTLVLSFALPRTLREIRQMVVLETLRLVNGNKTHASKLLGIDRRTLYRIIEGTEE